MKNFFRCFTASVNTMLLFYLIYNELFPHKAPFILLMVLIWDCLVYYCTFIRPYKEVEEL